MMYVVSEYYATLRAAAFVGLLFAVDFLLRNDWQRTNIRGFFLGRKRFSFWWLLLFDNKRLFAVWAQLHTDLRLRYLLNRKIRVFLPFNMSSFNAWTFFHGLRGCDDLYLFIRCKPFKCISLHDTWALCIFIFFLQNYLIVAFRFLI